MKQRGTKKKPVILRVQTMERAEEVIALCDSKGVKAIVGVEPDKPEDITDLEQNISSSAPIVGLQKIGRNEYCPCGSGRKYKKCCLNAAG